MRFVSQRPAVVAGLLGMALLMGGEAEQPPSAWAGSASGMPLVVPAQSLPSLGQLNGSTTLTVVCYSQAPVSSTGGTAQTAVVDLTPPSGTTGPGGSFSLFMFPQDVPAVQQLNDGMQVVPTGLFQLPSSGANTSTPIAQVKIAETGQMQASSVGCLLVCPVPSLPLMGQLNPGLRFDVLCTCQIGAVKVNPGAQTALLNIQPAQGKLDPSQPLPLWVPVSTLPTLGQLNGGATMDVIDVIDTTEGAGGSMLPIALVDIKQNPQPLGSVGSGQPAAATPSPPAAANDDEGATSSDAGGGGKGKGHGKGNGNGAHKGDKGDD